MHFVAAVHNFACKAGRLRLDGWPWPEAAWLGRTEARELMEVQREEGRLSGGSCADHGWLTGCIAARGCGPLCRDADADGLLRSYRTELAGSMALHGPPSLRLRRLPLDARLLPSCDAAHAARTCYAERYASSCSHTATAVEPHRLWSDM